MNIESFYRSVALLAAGSVLAIFSGCATNGAAVASHTLSANTSLHSSEIESCMGAEQWAKIKDRSYSGYVILRGSVSSEKKPHHLRVWKSFPDSSRDEAAARYAVLVPASAGSVGTRVVPQVEVAVVFYDSAPGGQAIVHAEQLTGAAATRSYLLHKDILIVNY